MTSIFTISWNEKLPSPAPNIPTSLTWIISSFVDTITHIKGKFNMILTVCDCVFSSHWARFRLICCENLSWDKYVLTLVLFWSQLLNHLIIDRSEISGRIHPARNCQYYPMNCIQLRNSFPGILQRLMFHPQMMITTELTTEKSSK